MFGLFKKKPEGYLFDFKAEVAKARAEYPDETKDCDFIDLSSPFAKRKIKKWVVRKSLGCKGPLAGLKALFMPVDVDMILAGIFQHRASSTAGIYTNAHLICIDSHKSPACLKDPHKNLFFVLSHELGHLVVNDEKKPHQLDRIKKNEDEADSFAVLRGFKEKVLDKNDVSQLVRSRTFSLTDHMTAETLEGFVSYGRDLTKSRPADIKALAHEHAAQYQADLQQLESLEKTLRQQLKWRYSEQNEITAAIGGSGAPFHSIVMISSSLRKRIASEFMQVAQAHAPGSFAYRSLTKMAKTAQEMSA